MNRTTIMVFSFIAGALLADVTHPAGSQFWKADSAITDSEVDCTDDCLEPMPPAQVMECEPSRDGTFLKCQVI